VLTLRSIWGQPARTIVLVVAGALILFQLVWLVRSWPMWDMDAYWYAGLRIRDGLPLYSSANWMAPGLDPINDPKVYRYAPWLAWLWAPLTLLPREAVNVGWGAVLLIAAVATLWPLLRHPTPASLALVGVVGCFELQSVRMGGIQALLVLPLVYRLERRDGPFWVGVAASLKLTPLAFALLFLMRRQWMRFAVAVAVTAALWAPVLLFNLSGYVTAVGDTILPVALWPVALVLALAGVAYSWRRPRFQAAATAVLTLVGSPKMHISYLSWLLAAPAAEPGARTFAKRFARSME